MEVVVQHHRTMAAQRSSFAPSHGEHAGEGADVMLGEHWNPNPRVGLRATSRGREARIVWAER